MPKSEIIPANCIEYLKSASENVHLTFLDPPFNQNKDYAFHDDNLSDKEYWDMMKIVCGEVFGITEKGGSVYFMQREKNTESVLRCLRETGWTLRNLVIWKKMTSAVPCSNKFGKHYQIIAYAVKGDKPRVFHRLRITPPLPPNYKYEREGGVFVTDIWDDIRELTSGYFAGDEAIRLENGERFHKQQAPVSLLLRIILSSSLTGDTVMDPFAGTGTTVVTAHQLGRRGFGIEIDPRNVEIAEDRLKIIRNADNVEKYYSYYRHTDNLDTIWGKNEFAVSHEAIATRDMLKPKQSHLFG